MKLIQYLPGFLTAFAVSLVLTRIIILTCLKKGWFSQPKEERWHRRPTPIFGGIGIWMAGTSVLLALGELNQSTITIVVFGSAMFTLGLVDDLFQLKAYTKFVFQIVIAALVVNAGIHITAVENPLLAFPISILWLVGITNAFNLLDNMDGLSAGIASIALFFFFIIATLFGNSALAMICVISLGAVLGFLAFNFPPARIFMGDSGSLYVGFLLATLTIQGTWHHASHLSLLLFAPVLLLGVAIFDTAIVSLHRVFSGRSIAEGGKDHSSHRLVALGWSEKEAVMIMYSLSFLLGTLTLVGLHFEVFVSMQVVLVVIVGLIAFGLFLSQVKVYEAKERKDADFPIPKDAVRLPYLLHKRRVAEIVMDALLIVVAYSCSYLIKYDGVISSYNWARIQESLPLILAGKMSAFFIAGLYSGIWKFIGFDDATKIFRSVFGGSVLSLLLILGFYRFAGYSRMLFIIDFILLLMFVTGIRVLLRLFRESLYGYAEDGRRILLVGAGEAGQWVLAEIRKSEHVKIRPMAILDDDPWKQGRKVFGVPVLGGITLMPKLSTEQSIEEVIIAIPSASEKVKRRAIEKCKELRLPFTVIRGVGEWSPDRSSPPTRSENSSHTDNNDSDWSVPTDPEQHH